MTTTEQQLDVEQRPAHQPTTCPRCTGGVDRAERDAALQEARAAIHAFTTWAAPFLWIASEQALEIFDQNQHALARIDAIEATGAVLEKRGVA